MSVCKGYVYSRSEDLLKTEHFIFSAVSNKITEIHNITSVSVATLCSSTSHNGVQFSFTGGLGVTPHHWDIASVNWDGSVVKSW